MLEISIKKTKRGQTEEIGLLLNENFHERQSQQKNQDNNNSEQQRHNPNHQMQENDRDYLSNNYEEEGQPDKEYLESESEVFAEMEDLWHSQLIGRDQLCMERNYTTIKFFLSSMHGRISYRNNPCRIYHSSIISSNI